MPNTSHPTKSVRIRRLVVFCLVVVFFFYAGINSGLAFGYAYLYTHASCPTNPKPPTGIGSPKEILLHTRDGLEIPAWYYPPENGAVVIALDGPNGALGSGVPPIEFLVQDGFGVIQIGSRACAKPKRAPVTLGGKEVWEVEAALAFLSTQPNLEHIGAFGYSMGGATAIRSAARFPQIEALIAEGGYFDLGNDIVEPNQPKSFPRKIFLYSVALAFWMQTNVNPWELSPINDLPKISPRPIYLIYGENELADGRGRLQFQVARKPKELWVVPRGSHGKNYQVAPEEYRQRVLDFFKRTLLNEAPPCHSPQ